MRAGTGADVQTNAQNLATDSAGQQLAAMRAESPRSLAWLLVLGGLAGFATAFILLLEKIALLEDPSYLPSCSISPLLSCGSVMNTAQAEVFGFPNPILGVAGYPVIMTVGVALLAGATFRRWFWAGLQVGVTAGALLVHWMIFESLYRIGALCPYCMVGWAVTIPIFWYVTLHNVRAGHTPVPAPLRRPVQTLATYHGAVLTGWFLVIAALILEQFWTYWSGLIT